MICTICFESVTSNCSFVVFAASKPHMEWLAAYRQAKDVSDGSSSQMTASGTVTSSTITTAPSAGTGEHLPIQDAGPAGSLFPAGCFPPGLDDQERLQALRANGLSLRYLLGSNERMGKQTGEGQNSASGCLRSIVQAVMQQGTKSHTSVTTTSVYASLVNGAPSKVEPVRDSPTSMNVTAQGSNTKTVMVNSGSDMTPPSGHYHQMEAVNANGHVDYRLVRPEPRRPDVYYVGDLQLAGVRRTSFEEHQSAQAYSQTKKSQDIGGQDSPPRRTMAVECQPAMTLLPERPASRDSTSSFTSSASSEEINVDDSSPVHYHHDRRRMDSLNSECSDAGIVRVASRKRAHSVESGSSSHSSCSQNKPHQGTPYVEACYRENYSCHTEELNVNTTSSAKVLRLDHNACDSHNVKEEDKKTYLSPTAVISSTGTPPPTVRAELREDSWKERIETQDISIQCELLVPPSGDGWKNQQLLGPEVNLSTLPDQSTNQDSAWFQRPCGSPALIGSVKCPHCGISFDDSVLHSIHMGCHSHSDPFICNVCGEQCSNKYGFYTHIMRGHHKH